MDCNVLATTNNKNVFKLIEFISHFLHCYFLGVMEHTLQKGQLDYVWSYTVSCIAYVYEVSLALCAGSDAKEPLPYIPHT